MKIGDRVIVSGGYDMDPAWLSGRTGVFGTLRGWVPGQNVRPACVLELDEEITASGRVGKRNEVVTGTYLVLELRYSGEGWKRDGVVHVELCAVAPEDVSWSRRQRGAWVESHASYEVAG